MGFAHRGGATSRADQNTLHAFKSALSRGARGLETDIGLTLDGVPVLAHAVPSLRRNMSIAQLRRDQLPASIPSLSDLYDHCGTGFDLSLDMAQPLAVGSVISTATQYGAEDRLWLTYWRMPEIRDWRRQWPHIRLIFPTMPWQPGHMERTILELSGIGGIALNVYHRLYSRRALTQAHEADVPYFVWGIKSRASLARAVQRGVDGVFCDDVDAMVDVLRRED